MSAGDAPPPPGARDPAWTEATTSDTSLTEGSSGLDQRVILVVQKIPRTSNTPGRGQGGWRQGEEEEEVERVHGRQVGHEVLFKRGEDHVNEAGGRQGVMRQKRPPIRRVERTGARNVAVCVCFYFVA